MKESQVHAASLNNEITTSTQQSQKNDEDSGNSLSSHKDSSSSEDYASPIAPNSTQVTALTGLGRTQKLKTRGDRNRKRKRVESNGRHRHKILKSGNFSQIPVILISKPEECSTTGAPNLEGSIAAESEIINSSKAAHGEEEALKPRSESAMDSKITAEDGNNL